MDPADAHINAYQGNEFQQSVSVLANTNQECYEKEGQCYSEYAVEYKPGFDEGVSRSSFYLLLRLMVCLWVVCALGGGWESGVVVEGRWVGCGSVDGDFGEACVVRADGTFFPLPFPYPPN